MRRFRSVLPLVAALMLLGATASSTVQVPPAAYTYDSTKQLVSLVENAAHLIAQRGLQPACAQFSRKGSAWYTPELYLFVYKLDGTCVCHATTPSLVGKNLMRLRDMNGKPIIALITDVGRKPGPDAHGWVFYLWQEQTQLGPSWKSAYIRKVVAPDGVTYVVGSGLYQMRVEKAWVQERVDEAAALLQRDTENEAFAKFRNPASRFVFLNTYIFVLDAHGKTLVDPAFPTMAGRNLANFTDAVGAHPVREALRKLQRSDTAWAQYLWPQPGSGITTRKLIYMRKVSVHGTTLYVGADFFLATPIWMKT